MYVDDNILALRTDDSNLSTEDARDRIEKDCVGIWSKRTILDALPDEAKARKKQKAGRLSQKDHVLLHFLQHQNHINQKKRLLLIYKVNR